MALFNCPFCGSVVSDRAAACVKCNRSFIYPNMNMPQGAVPPANSVMPQGTVPPANPGQTGVYAGGMDDRRKKALKGALIAIIPVLIIYLLIVYIQYQEFREEVEDDIRMYERYVSEARDKENDILSDLKGLEGIIDKIDRYEKSSYSDLLDYDDLYSDYLKYGSKVPRYYFDRVFNKTLRESIVNECKEILDEYSKAADEKIQCMMKLSEIELQKSYGIFKWYFKSEFGVYGLIIFLAVIVSIFLVALKLLIHDKNIKV